MWVATPFGILMPGLRPPHTVPEGDTRLLQVRARRIRDLRILKAEYLPELGDIIEIPHTDYQFRAYCTHEQWGAALAKMAMDIDYVKFKEQSERKYGDKALHNLYVRMWGQIFNAFPKGSVYDKRKPVTSTYTTRWAPPMRASDSLWNAHGDQTLADSRMIEEDYSDILDKWDDEVPPARRPSGFLDHSTCRHGNSKNAKRRCRNRWSK